MSLPMQGVYSLTHTKRRRILWCAWWKSPPAADPFVPPDAWSAGLRTEQEAIAQAEAAAGISLQRIEGRWAGAWVRVRAGLPPFFDRPQRAATTEPEQVNPFKILRIAHDADLATIRLAYRQLALTTHPDHGGDAASFIAVRRAYTAVLRRRKSR
jgi:hypothetical protein